MSEITIIPQNHELMAYTKREKQERAKQKLPLMGAKHVPGNLLGALHGFTHLVQATSPRGGAVTTLLCRRRTRGRGPGQRQRARRG